MNVPADCRNHWLPHVPDSDASDCVIGSDVDGANIVATSRSFHTQMNSQHRERRERRRGQRQDDPEEDLPVSGAVHARRLDHLARDLGDEVVQQEDRQRQREDRVRDPDRREAVVDVAQLEPREDRRRR